MQTLNYFFFALIHQTSIYWFHVSDIGDTSAKRKSSEVHAPGEKAGSEHNN